MVVGGEDAVTRAGRPECDGCKRSSRVTAIYARMKPELPAVLLGRYGPRCFLVVARGVVKQGWVPEREDARPVRLRSSR